MTNPITKRTSVSVSLLIAVVAVAYGAGMSVSIADAANGRSQRNEQRIDDLTAAFGDIKQSLGRIEGVLKILALDG